MVRKKFDTIEQLKSHPGYVVSQTFKEILTIGDMEFLLHTYTFEDEDDSYVAFGCYYKHKSTSPVFETFSQCMRYAIECYNDYLKKSSHHD